MMSLIQLSSIKRRRFAQMLLLAGGAAAFQTHKMGVFDQLPVTVEIILFSDKKHRKFRSDMHFCPVAVLKGVADHALALGI